MFKELPLKPSIAPPYFSDLQSTFDSLFGCVSNFGVAIFPQIIGAKIFLKEQDSRTLSVGKFWFLS